MMQKTCLEVMVPARAATYRPSRSVRAQTACCLSSMTTAFYIDGQIASYNDENYFTTYWMETQNPFSSGDTAETREPWILAAFPLHPPRFHDTSLTFASPGGHSTETTRVARGRIRRCPSAVESLSRNMSFQKIFESF